MTTWIINLFETIFDFSNALNTSIAAGWMILAVILLRFLLRNAPKWISLLLWGLVAIRLLLPFSLESAFSLIPSSQTVPSEILQSEGMQLQIPARLDIISNPLYSDNIQIELEQTVDRMQIQMINLTLPWILGIAVFLFYALISYLRISKKVTTAVLYRENIFQSEYIDTPFVLGIFRPKIYLPYNVKSEHFEYVIAHEQAHISRKDHWWKPLGFLLRTIYWFHPLMWLAYALFCRDMELACDEKVIRNWNNGQKATYMEALLACSLQRPIGFSCPLAFGEIGVKERVKAIMNYKKPAFWLLASAIIACIGIAICFLTNPIGSSIQNPYVQEYEPNSTNSIGNVDKEMFERISEDFSIGADKYGRAVFKNPQKAFDTLQKQYTLGINLIRDNFDLAPLSHKNYSVYKTYGWQVKDGTQEAREQATFITTFLDIYENSFTKEIPKQTAQTTNPNNTDPNTQITNQNETASNQNTQTEHQATTNSIINLPKEIVMVKGELYFYTDYENTITRKCGVMDGEITSTVKENEIPTKDNQSNFGVGYGYQYSTEGRIEVYRNNSWQIFATEEVWKKLQLQSQETTALEDAISTAILEKYSNHVAFGNILVESHVVLANEVMSATPKVGQTTHITEETVYLLVLIQEYSAYDRTLVEVGGSYLPVAITLSTQDGMTYTIKEYWEPRDGAYHAKDIRSKFPGESAEDALTKQQDYRKDLEAECYAKALAHLERVGTLDFQISNALDSVVFEMAKSSDTNAPIPTQLADYQKLLSYGAYTLRYCFSEFLQEKQTDLQYSREYVMANVCQEIALAWGEAVLFPDTNPSGKEWFEAFMENANELAKQYNKEELEKMYPASFLLLQMMQE